MRTVHSDTKAYLPWFICRNAPNDYLVRMTSEDLSCESYTTELVSNGRNCGIEIEFAAVLGCIRMRWKPQINIPEWLVSFLVKRHAHEFLFSQVLRFALFTREKEFPDLGQILHRAFVLVFVRLARPKGIFIELEMLISDPPIEHAAEPAIADGQCLDPFLRGLGVPKRKGGISGHEPLSREN